MRLQRFVTVGVLNTLFGLGVIFAAKALLAWGDLGANVLGYASGLVLSFALNRNWTFGHRGAVSPALLRFVAAFVFAYLVNLATVFGLRDLAGADSCLAQAAGVVPYAPCFYLASRRFVFVQR
jgi:putative flippase GtrA